MTTGQNQLDNVRQIMSSFDTEKQRVKTVRLGDQTDEVKTEFSPITAKEIEDILSLTIKHDDVNKLLTFLAMISAYTEDSQLNIMFNAPSSTGKSYIPLEVKNLFPDADIISLAEASPTAFFHCGRFDKEGNVSIVDLERKILILLDQPHQQLLERLRSLLSHDQKIIEHRITDKTQRYGTRTKRVQLIGYCAVVFCTSSLRMDEQESTRCLLLSPDVTQEKLKAGIAQKIQREADKELFTQLLESNPDRKKLKDRIRAIKQEKISEIKISQENQAFILESFLRPSMLKPKDQRDIGRILSLCKIFALLNCWFRKRNGNSITVDEADIHEAFMIWRKIRESQELSIPPYLYRFYQEIILPAYQEKNQSSNAAGLTRKEILLKHMKLLGRPLAMDKLRFEILPQLESSGLIYQEVDTNDKRNKLVYPTSLANQKLLSDI